MKFKLTRNWLILAAIFVAAFVAVAIFADEGTRDWIHGLLILAAGAGPGLLHHRDGGDGDGTPPSSTALVAVLFFFTAGCGAASSDVVRPVYQLASEMCMQLQQDVVDREGSSREEDDADIARIRERCGTAYLGLDALGMMLAEEMDQ